MVEQESSDNTGCSTCSVNLCELCLVQWELKDESQNVNL
jgi:hypothetical protein